MQKKFLWIAVAFVVGLSAIVIAIVSVSTTNDSTQTSLDEDISQSISIAASFYPLAYFAEQIGGEYATVINIAGSGDPHSYRPVPSDITAMLDADAVLTQGEVFEPWIADLQSQLDVAGVYTVHILDELGIVSSEHEGEYEHEHEHEHEEEHHHGGIDPHTWTDPVLARQMAGVILNVFLSLDPDHSSVYEANAESLDAKLASLDARYRQTLDTCVRRDVIVSHDAFGYLAKRYGFITHPIAGLSTSDEPSAKTLADIRAEAEEVGATHILAEEGNVKRFAETLSRETGLAMLSINPLGRGTLDPNKDYFDGMNDNLETFAIALGCAQ
jgi:zinc transport system substrate-binding protein